MRHKVKSALWIVAVGYAASALGFVITLLLAKALGAQLFAVVAAGLAIGGFLVPLIDLGSAKAFSRDATDARQTASLGQLARANFRVRMTVTIASAGASALLAAYLTDSPTNAVALLAFALWAGLQGLYPAAWHDHSGTTTLQNYFVLGERVASLCAVGGFFVLPEAYRHPLVVGVALLTIRASSVLLQMQAWWARLTPALPPNTSRLGWHQSGTDWRITLALTLNALLIYGNQLVIERSRDAAELSSYALAFQLMSMVFVFQSQIVRIRTRGIAESRSDAAAFSSSVLRTGAVMTGGSLLLAVIAWGVIEGLQRYFLGPQYALISHVVPFFVAWVTLLGFGLSITQHNLVMNQGPFYLATAAIGGGSAIVLGVLLIPTYGVTAAAAILLGVHAVMILAGTLRLRYSIVRWGERSA